MVAVLKGRAVVRALVGGSAGGSASAGCRAGVRQAAEGMQTTSNDQNSAWSTTYVPQQVPLLHCFCPAKSAIYLAVHVPFMARELDSMAFEGPFQLHQFYDSVMTLQLVTGFGGIIMFMFTEESTAGEKKKKPSPRLNVHSAFWILASIAVTYYFDFFKSIKETIQADR